MALTVPVLLTVLMVYLGYDHCSDCRPDGETETSLNNIENLVNEIYDKAARRKYLCGIKLAKPRYFIKRREIDLLSANDSDSGDDTAADPDLDKILGGRYVMYGEIPWMAQVLYNKEHVCGAAIISDFWIISAAHCFRNSNKTAYQIAVGGHVLGYNDPHEKIYDVKTIVIHEQYRARPQDFDIALVLIKARRNGSGIALNDYVHPICLATLTDDLPYNAKLIFSGWGHTSTANRNSQVLKTVILPLLSRERCKSVYEEKSDYVCCAGVVNGDGALCSGDTGGPVAYLYQKTYTLFGIAIISSVCGRTNTPAIFTYIPNHFVWIFITTIEYSSDYELIMPVPPIHTGRPPRLSWSDYYKC